MNDFISRRLHSMPPASSVMVVQYPGVAPVSVCTVLLGGASYTRVWDNHSLVHFTGDVPVHEAANRFLEGDG